jgi:acetyltransferase-like isoleucine patch superfamily enzyme
MARVADLVRVVGAPVAVLPTSERALRRQRAPQCAKLAAMTTIDDRVLLYGVGSPLAIDAEDCCGRAGLVVAAGVHNVDGPVYVSDAVRIFVPAALSEVERTLACIVPLFTPGHRRAAVADAARNGVTRGATLIDPSATVARSASVASGAWINAGVVVGGLSALAEWVLVNRSASVGHHAVLEAYASIGPAAVLAGLVHVGRGAMIGAGAIVLPRVRIGSNAVVAAGSLVRDDVPDHAQVEGHPARVVREVAGYRGIEV